MATAEPPGDPGGPSHTVLGCLGFWRLRAAIFRHKSGAFRMWFLIWILGMSFLAQYAVSTQWMTPREVTARAARAMQYMERAVSGAAGRAERLVAGKEADSEVAQAAPAAAPAAALMTDSSNEVAAGRPPTPAPSPSSVTLDALEEAVRMSVERLAQNDAMAASLGARLLKEVASQLQLRTSPPPDCSQCSCRESLPGRAPPWPDVPPLYVVTPTYRRPEQLAELTRLAQTLLLVRNVRWLVIEDAKTPSKHVAKLLKESGLQYEHLTAAMPEQYRKRRGAKPKGVAQRNRGIQWLRANATAGVLYFADDDNTYDVAIFEEIRTTRRVSMFPVGLCTKLGLSTPVVSSTGTFMGFYDGWVGGRKFPVDMAGFAVSIKFLNQRPKAQMPFVPGFEEDGFLRSLAPFEPKEIELKADNCTKVLVWHTQSKANAPSPPLDIAKYNQTNLTILKTIIV